ncbi:MAG: hypothetical protein RIS47_2188 [Bacteroidota bacterium]|jgi:HlyD family secretion protein
MKKRPIQNFGIFLRILANWTLPVLLGGVFCFPSCKSSALDAEGTGSFEATEVIVSAEANGKLTKFDVVEGQSVKSGDALASIDSVQLYLKKMQLLASKKAVLSRTPNVSTQMAGLRQQIATAVTERKRVENLLKADAATQKQLDDINGQISVLEKQLAAMKSSLEISVNGIGTEGAVVDIQIAQLDDQLTKCLVRSPLSGVVLAKYAEMGELATMGKALLKIADVDNMYLRAYITNDQLARIKLGQKVKVSCDEGDSKMRSYEGVIAWISEKSEFTPKTVQTKDERTNMVYAVKIAVKNDGFLKIGMYGEFKIM